MNTTSDINEVKTLLAELTDPEIPVLSLDDLGVIRGINYNEDRIVVTITPTYSACPAVEMMKQQILETLSQSFSQEIIVKTQLSPAWTTDWITEKGKKALFEYGIMPPTHDGLVICPQCNSENVELISQFGSTACKALYKCNNCLEPFDYFKCH